MMDIIREPALFTDDAKLIADLIKKHWALGPDQVPNIEYIPESFMVDARIGNIYVYVTSRHNSISSIDYANLQRTTDLTIRVSNRHRDNHMLWCAEIYRILSAYRRGGPCRLGGYLFLEIRDDYPSTDLSGWYTTMFDIRLTTYVVPMVSAGFSDSINKTIDDFVTKQGD